MSHALAFQDFTLGYGPNVAVQSLQAQIAEGSLTAIVGPNGAGKSTLLKGIAGVLSPISGQVCTGELKRSDIAYLPQHSEIDRSFPISVEELVATGLWSEVGPFGHMNKNCRLRVMEAISAVGLEGFENRTIEALSGGQMQRALFARLLLQDARVVLLDEPFTAIDTRTTADLIDVIKHWNGAGRTVLSVLHDLDLVRAHFPDTLMIARELVAFGATDEVLTAENQFRARQMCEACSGPPHTCGRDAA